MATRLFTRESLIRALTHHETRGAVHLATPPYPGHRHWRIKLLGQDAQDFSTPQVYAMCLGLAASEAAAARAARRRPDGAA